jgi:hypothetical protein
VRGFLGAGVLIAALIGLVLVLAFVALSSLYRARCEGNRPQYIFVVPTRDPPRECRGAISGFRVLRNFVQSGEAGG